MSQAEIHEVELSIEATKEMIARGNMADRLPANSDFKQIVMEGYFKDEAARLALLASEPGLTVEQREHVARDINGLGAFFRYLQFISRMGRQAQEDLKEYQDALDEMRAEELGEELDDETIEDLA